QAGTITGATYIEAKLRTSAAPNAAVEAETQLHRDMQERFPHILTFVANQLHIAQSPLTRAVAKYMRARTRGADIDAFRIHLTWEATAWSEVALHRLDGGPHLLEPLTVSVVVVDGLSDLLRRVYALIGAEVDSDDD